MKLNQVNYTRPNNRINAEYKKQGKAPSFGMNPAVAFATFIEKNGFLGEFLAVDSTGMMGPRGIQGFLRNREELGHLNYKAGREELVRELLSGPAFFYVPLTVLSLASLLKGKAAKVDVKTLGEFKNIMKNTAVDMKNAVSTKKNFVKTIVNDAFKGFEHEKGLIDEVSQLMEQNVTKKFSFKDSLMNMFRKKEDKVATASTIKAKASELVTKINKANEKNLDNTGVVKVNGKDINVTDLFDDMRNYLDDFTAKAGKTAEDSNTFIEKFHETAKNLRYAANILSVAGLSAFLVIIPKLYQTGKTFPGTDGLNTGANNNATSNNVKEAV